MVILNGKNIKIKKPVKKLNYKILSLYKIIKVISFTAIFFKFLRYWLIYNIFYISFIELYRVNN